MVIKLWLNVNGLEKGEKLSITLKKKLTSNLLHVILHYNLTC